MLLHVLHIVYVVYFLLAGMGGIALYPNAVRIAWRRIAEFMMFGSVEPSQMRSLLVSCGIVLICCMQVQFCFMMAAAVVRLM
jgi:hypothetical protein